MSYTKEEQLKSTKKKKESTFGKKPYKWNKEGKPKKKPDERRGNIVDEDYLKWVGTQPCAISGQTGVRGIAPYDIHVHHIKGRGRGRNDYEVIALKGYYHSWGKYAYHNNTKEDFVKINGLLIDDIDEFFEDCAHELLKKYIEQGGVIKKAIK